MLVEVVLDFLEIILDAAESAAMPAGLEEEDEVAWLLRFRVWGGVSKKERFKKREVSFWVPSSHHNNLEYPKMGSFGALYLMGFGAEGLLLGCVA